MQLDERHGAFRQGHQASPFGLKQSIVYTRANTQDPLQRCRRLLERQFPFLRARKQPGFVTWDSYCMT